MLADGTTRLNGYTTNGTLTTTGTNGTLSVSSDSRLKNSIVTLPEDSLAKILNVQPCTYKLNSDVNNNTTISYRGNKRELLNYNNKKEFKKRDIYCAIRREAKDDTHAVCRMMPVIYNEKMNWVGIYLICALDQTVN
jgi:hypothetical protein